MACGLANAAGKVVLIAPAAACGDFRYGEPGFLESRQRVLDAPAVEVFGRSQTEDLPKTPGQHSAVHPEFISQLFDAEGGVIPGRMQKPESGFREVERTDLPSGDFALARMCGDMGKQTIGSRACQQLSGTGDVPYTIK